MGRVVLPSGGWAELRGPEALTERQRRPLKLAVTRNIQAAQRNGFTFDPTKTEAENNIDAVRFQDAEMAVEAESAAIVAFVAAWSFGPEPTADSVLDLAGGDYDALVKVTLPLVGKAFLGTKPTPDPASPIEPSNGSGPRSEGNELPISAPNGVTTASFS